MLCWKKYLLYMIEISQKNLETPPSPINIREKLREYGFNLL